MYAVAMSSVRLLAELARGTTGRRTYLYFVQAGEDGPVKIGIAGNVAHRVGTLQNGNHETLQLLAVHPCAAGLEQRVHEHFALHRIHGEWFRPVEVILDLARGLRIFHEIEGAA